MRSVNLPVTFGLIAACVAVYVVVAAGGAALGGSFGDGLLDQPGAVLSLGALIPGLVAGGEAWRLLTSVFLHSGITHLLLNMLSLYFLGQFVEPTFGRWRFLALYLISGLAGGLAYLYVSPSGGPAVGASGAIFGLLGGVFGFSLQRGTFSLQNPVISQLLFLTAINLFIGASIPQVSNTAHIGGLVGGLVFGYLMAPSVYSQKRLVAATPVAIALVIEIVLLIVWYVILS